MQGNFETIKDELIKAINQVLDNKGYSTMLVDVDGDIDEVINIDSSVGETFYDYLCNNYNTIEEFIENLEGAHFISNFISISDVQSLVNEIVYLSTNNFCIGIDDLKVIVLK